MPTDSRKLRLAGMLLMFALTTLLDACGNGEPEVPAAGIEQGTITVSGAFALYPMMIRWGEEFHQLHPGVRFDISAGGAGKGMSDALAGAVDIGMVSRPIFDEEVQKGAFWVAVAKDAVVATVNKENPVLPQLLERGLTRSTGEGIWISGRVTSWGQAVSAEATDSIHVYTRADACGAAQTWAEYLGGYQQEDLQGVGVQADPGLAEAVRQDPLGIGYNNLNFAYDADTGKPVAGIEVIPLDINENGLIDAEEQIYGSKDDLVQAIGDGRYPSPPARPLNLVTRGKPIWLVRTFIEWIMTDGQQYLQEVGYIQLSQELLDDGLSRMR